MVLSLDDTPGVLLGIAPFRAKSTVNLRAASEREDISQSI